MKINRIVAKYWIETAFPLEEAARALAGAQSGGTFVPVPGETDDRRRSRAAIVEFIRELDPAASPSLPGAALPKDAGPLVYRRAEIAVSWPFDNMGASLPNLLAAVAGNLFELKHFSGLRLLDISLPAEFLSAYQGPQFGVAGTRRLAGVEGRPIVGTIIKPSIGLSPEETATLVKTIAEAGIDFIKDDELQSDAPHCPFAERVAAVMRVLNDHACKTGKKVMYAFNVTGEIDEMLRRHDVVLAHEGTCVMVSMNSIGLPAMARLRRNCQLPVHAHRNGWGLFSRSPFIGISYVAYQKFWRLAGVDQMHVNGIRNKFCEPDESVLASARECLTPMFPPPAPGCQVIPVFGSGQTAVQAPDTYTGLGCGDLIYVCGGGVMAHPDGVAAGVLAIRQAWEAAASSIPLTEFARTHRELRRALERFQL